MALSQQPAVVGHDAVVGECSCDFTTHLKGAAEGRSAVCNVWPHYVHTQARSAKTLLLVWSEQVNDMWSDYLFNYSFHLNHNTDYGKLRWCKCDQCPYDSGHVIAYMTPRNSATRGELFFYKVSAVIIVIKRPAMHILTYIFNEYTEQWWAFYSCLFVSVCNIAS